MADSQQKTVLFNKLVEGKLSTGELDELIEWLGNDQLDPEARLLILEELTQSIPTEQVSLRLQADLNAKLPVILSAPKIQNSVNQRIISLHSTWLRYAAVIILLMSASIVFFISKNENQSKNRNIVKHTLLKSDIAPGKDGAVLTLADGSTLVLDSMGNGLVATQNGSSVLLKKGQLAYNSNGTISGPVTYNTISTPKGREFQLVLSDGTKVWLNAASSLHYPTSFSGTQRSVEVSGEAYFEVAKNAKMPFRVKINDETEIEVLGTHFNINAYKNETNINTTLLEGAVQIIRDNKKTMLKPGQQAQIKDQHSNAQVKIVNDVDVEKVVAWKNGVFNFQDASLEEVMRQLERWYDIEVVYETNIPKLEFIGKIGRDLTLSNVLHGLEVSKVHCRLEGRKLIILP